MSGCARTCVLWVLGVVAFAAAFYVYLRPFGILDPQIYWASGGAGFCVTICIAFVVGIWNSSRERGTLLDSLTGTPPEDGQWVAVSGHIRSSHPLRTPLAGASAVAYEYKISRMERSGKSTSEVIYFDGKALAASTIATRQGTVRLLSVPVLDIKPETLDTRAAVENAIRYVSSNAFETTATPKAQRKGGLEKEWTDDDGSFRVDKRPNTQGVDLADCRYHEKSIKQGEMVCAFGLYSRQRGGLIPHPNWAKQTRLMRGDASDVARQLRKRITGYAIGLVVFAAVAYGVVWLYRHNAPAPAVASVAQASRAD